MVSRSVGLDGPIGGTWARGDSFVLFSASHPPSSSPPPSLSGQPERERVPDVAVVEWPDLSTALMQRWHDIFSGLNRTSRAEVSAEEVLKASRHYRAEMEATRHEDLSLSLSPSSRAEALREMEAIWQLFEICFIDPHDNVTAQLTDWQRGISLLEAEREGPMPAGSEEWWRFALRALACGRTDLAFPLFDPALSSASASDPPGSSPFSFLPSRVAAGIRRLLHSVPALTCRHMKRADFQSRHVEHRNDVQSLRCSHPALDAHPYMSCLLDVMEGDESRLAQVANDWPSLLVSILIHSRPHLSKTDLPDLVRHARQLMNDAFMEQSPIGTAEPVDSLRESLYEDILSLRCQAAIEKVDRYFARSFDRGFDQSFFTAHLTDLLERTGNISSTAVLLLLPDEHSHNGNSGNGLDSHLSRSRLLTDNGTSSALTPVDTCKSTRNNAQPSRQPFVCSTLLSCRGWHILRYVNHIQYNESLWWLLAPYAFSLSSSSVTASELLTEAFLAQMPTSASNIHRLQSWARKHNLDQFVIDHVTRSYAQSLFQAGEIGTAVRWFRMTGTQGMLMVSRIVQQMLTALFIPLGVDSTILSTEISQQGPSLNNSSTWKTRSTSASPSSSACKEALIEAARKNELDRVSKLAHDLDSVLSSLESQGNGEDYMSDSGLSLSIQLLQHWRQYLNWRQELSKALCGSFPDPPSLSVLAQEKVLQAKNLLHQLISHLTILLVSTMATSLRRTELLAVLSHLAAMLAYHQKISDSGVALLSTDSCQKLLIVAAEVLILPTPIVTSPNAESFNIVQIKKYVTSSVQRGIRLTLFTELHLSLSQNKK